MPQLVASLKLLLFFAWCLVMVPPQLLLLAMHKGPGAYFLPHIWHKGVCRIFGLKARIEGVPCRNGQVLFMSNHLSYLDIPLLGASLKASFVAKAEVADWPVFGFLSKLQQTAFISRARRDANKEKGSLDQMLKEGKSLILFPEGTSTDGRDVRPFKSSLFSLALSESGKQNSDLMIQPVTICLEQVDGHGIETQDDRDLYAWHIDMTTPLPAHLWRFAGCRGARLTLKFHPALRACEYQDRKILAKLCHDNVSNGLKAYQAA